MRLSVSLLTGKKGGGGRKRRWGSVGKMGREREGMGTCALSGGGSEGRSCLFLCVYVGRDVTLCVSFVRLCLSAYPSSCLSVSLYVYLPVRLFVCLSSCLATCSNPPLSLFLSLRIFFLSI